MTTRSWKTETDLAALIMQKVNANKRVTLSPETALFVSLQLTQVSTKPTRNEVALMICRWKEKCSAPCYECMSRANVVVAAYGQRLEEKK